VRFTAAKGHSPPGYPTFVFELRFPWSAYIERDQTEIDISRAESLRCTF
jgi:hypothetical protein